MERDVTANSKEQPKNHKFNVAKECWNKCGTLVNCIPQDITNFHFCRQELSVLVSIFYNFQFYTVIKQSSQRQKLRPLCREIRPDRVDRLSRHWKGIQRSFLPIFKYDISLPSTLHHSSVTDNYTIFNIFLQRLNMS